MTSADQYLARAAHFEAIANSQSDPKLQAEFGVLAAGYRLLAQMASLDPAPAET